MLRKIPLILVLFANVTFASVKVNNYKLLGDVVNFQKYNGNVDYHVRFHQSSNKTSTVNDNFLAALKNSGIGNLGNDSLDIKKFSSNIHKFLEKDFLYQILKNLSLKLKEQNLNQEQFKFILNLLPYSKYSNASDNQALSMGNLSLDDHSKLGQFINSAKSNDLGLIYNNSIPVSKDTYQYLGSSIQCELNLLKNESLFKSEILVRKYYRINKKIESLINQLSPIVVNIENDDNSFNYLTIDTYLSTNTELESMYPTKTEFSFGQLLSSGDQNEKFMGGQNISVYQYVKDELVLQGKIEKITYDYTKREITVSPYNFTNDKNLILSNLKLDSFLNNN